MTESQISPAIYTHGHHESVLRSHSWRTAANSAGYLLPYLKPDMHILDIGCGPGTITIDLARLVPEGHVVGLEYASEVLPKARAAAAENGITNVEFRTGDICDLHDIKDNTFDVVHCHQVLQHISDPVKALSEMRRVAKDGGIVAARESDVFTWYPEVEGMEDWHRIYHDVARKNGGQPEAGRRLVSWALQAGFDRTQITASAGTWCFSTPEERAWWSEMWADRTVGSNFARSATGNNLATREQLEQIARTWRKWGEQEDGWFTLLHGQIICRP
ncbi:S-adenosyl-L-methionine-dependent methyltransferase [Hygrophoropsis aurantiaca]|uniref:S-adenosyl-L-methionine-dependent methyltransferase n=1 Tax=Hygrophoropsis aurantiaca TaxID=72124 RepID=A0ACB8AW57_9AGAM|nr:S-adenosyl-L-methionine-dependent methyltransferase [Hygrophoropsis aurantiaca]